MNLFRITIVAQAVYYLLTALWPIIDIQSFMRVTGYKHDIWLVKTVGALLIPESLTMISYLFIRTDRRPVFILGSLSCVAFICVDLYYSLTDVIHDIYLADAVLQCLLLISWLWIIFKNHKTPTP